MDAKKDINIQFAGLSSGEHQFEYELGDSFFEKYPYSEIKRGKLSVKVNILKQTTLLILDITISGTVEVECDRCLESFDIPAISTNRLIVKLGGEVSGDEDEDVVTVPVTAHELNLSQYIYEYVIVSIPLKRVHPDDAKGNCTCDAEVMKRLNQLNIKKENQEQTDPRWQALKNIKLN